MDIVIVLGADSSMGVAVSQRLIGMGMRVFGVGQDFSKNVFNHKYFHPVKCSTQTTHALNEFADYILKTYETIYAIIYVAPFVQDHMIYKDQAMYNLVFNQLMAPFILTERFELSIKKQKGYIVLIHWNQQGILVQEVLNAASKKLAEQLFRKLSEASVKVLSIELSPQTKHVEDTSLLFQGIDPGNVADAIEQFFRYKEGNLITSMSIGPQNKEAKPIYTQAGHLSTHDRHPLPLHLPKKESPIHTQKPKTQPLKDNSFRKTDRPGFSRVYDSQKPKQKNNY